MIILFAVTYLVIGRELSCGLMRWQIDAHGDSCIVLMERAWMVYSKAI